MENFYPETEHFLESHGYEIDWERIQLHQADSSKQKLYDAIDIHLQDKHLVRQLKVLFIDDYVKYENL